MHSPGGWVRVSQRLRNAVPTIVALGLIVAVWELFIVVTGEPEYVLPPLHRILETGIEHATDRFLPNAWVTLVEMLLGFGLGVSAGLVLGTVIFHSRLLRQALLPIVISTQAIPVIAIAPILILWFVIRDHPQGDRRRPDLLLSGVREHDLRPGLGGDGRHQPDAFLRRDRAAALHQGAISRRVAVHLHRGQERCGDQRHRRDRRRVGGGLTRVSDR